MADEILRRNLDRAFDPGPDFPHRSLVPRTMAILELEAIPLRRLPSLRFPRRVLPAIAALLALAILATLLFAARTMDRNKTSPVHTPRPGTAVWPVHEQGYWSANDAAVAVDRDSGDNSFTIEITHDAGRTWTVTTFRYFFAPTLQWFDSRHLILYGDHEAVLTTADGGDHWNYHQSRLNLHPENTYFLSVDEGWTLCPTSGGCATGTNTPPDDYTLYHTTDSGRHWESLAHGFSSSSGGPDTAFFADSKHGFINTYSRDGFGELFVTADGGTKWRLVQVPAAVDGQPDTGGTTQPPIMFGKRGVLVVETTSGVFSYTTTDYGLTWGSPQALPGRPGKDSFGHCCRQLLSADDWSDWWTVDDIGMLFRSTDQGKTWRHISAWLGPGVVLRSVMPVGGNILWGAAVTGSDWHRFPIQSVDGGATWSVIKLSVAQPRVWSISLPSSIPRPAGGCDRKFAC
jgi:photosystem II stability/assembly factor-like uncharacterized protein